ncbi:hypothetical protein, partial [Methylibium sp.]|uniref:hypothetical protein n=1 Tax=Methylibium sp. TaxID=2067992 RepID=UPI0017C91268
MIVYLHPSQQPIVPPWLDGFTPQTPGVELVQRQTAHGCLVGIGDPLVIDCPPMRILMDVEDGWRAAVIGKLNPAHLWRGERWCRTLPATSIGGETWQAPVILTEDGERAYLVRYAGRDYLPQPS